MKRRTYVRVTRAVVERSSDSERAWIAIESTTNDGERIELRLVIPRRGASANRQDFDRVLGDVPPRFARALAAGADCTKLFDHRYIEISHDPRGPVLRAVRDLTGTRFDDDDGSEAT